MRPYVEELSRVASCYVSAHPNAGLPNPFVRNRLRRAARQDRPVVERIRHQRLPQYRRRLFAATSPAHIKAIAEALKDVQPRRIPDIEHQAAPVRAGTVQHRRRHAVRQRRRAHQRHRLENVRAADPERRLRRGGQRWRASRWRTARRFIDINMDEAMLDSQAAMTRFVNLLGLRAGHLARAADDRFVQVGRD